MITTMGDTFRETLALAVEEAKKGHRVAVSRTVPLAGITPLHFFAAAGDAFSGERTFWMPPESDTVMVGAGNEWIIDTDETSNGRFMDIETEWKRFKFIREAGSPSPVLMGGFSFDPLKNSSAKWKEYKNGRFTLPKYICRWGHAQKPEVTICKVLKNDESFSEAEADFLARMRYIQNLPEVSGMQAVNPAPFEMMEHHTDEWLHSILQATKAIKEGQLDKVVLAREISMKSEDPIGVQSALDTLIKEQQTSFRFVIENNSSSFIGATPERLVKIQDRFMQSACLAGTIKRGSSKKEDRFLENSLLCDQKNLEEHAYVVKMIREALQEHSSELAIPDSPGIYKTKNVQHLYTPIEGMLSEDSSLLHIVKQLHPTPALGGLPQLKALEMIREIEPMERGWYAAPIGWIDAEGNGEFAVAIRSALIEDHSAALYAGCGIVKDSVPEMEYEETKIKLRPMLSALGGLKYDRT